jgi:hypothetical protein
MCSHFTVNVMLPMPRGVHVLGSPFFIPVRNAVIPPDKANANAYVHANWRAADAVRGGLRDTPGPPGRRR